MRDRAEVIGIELNHVGWAEALERDLDYPAAPELAAAFVGELLTEPHFSRLAQVNRSNRCKVMASLSGALALRRKLEKAWLEFFLRRGYAVAQRMELDSMASALFDDLPWNGAELQACFRELQLGPGESVVRFSHDADPVWLVQAEDGPPDPRHRS